MNKFKTLKITTFYILTAVITFCIIFGVYFYHFSSILAIILLSIGLFAIIIPIYYLLSYINKTEEALKHDLIVTSSEIRHIDKNSYEKIKAFNGFEAIASSLDEVYERDSEAQKTQEILNDILICAIRNLKIEEFIDQVLDKIMTVISSECAVFYILNKVTNKLEIKASKGFSKTIYSQYDVNIGEGFLGNAAAKNEVKIIEDLPDDTVFIINACIGKIKPKNLIVVPVCDENNEVLGVFAAASLYKYTKEHQKILDRVKEIISYAIENGNYYNKTLRVANELKFQNQLIQNLNDDLENKIKARTIFLNGIINSIKDTAIISINSNSIITTFNKTAEEMLMMTSDEVIGKNVKILTPESAEIEKKISDAIVEAIKNKTSSDIFEMINKAGRKFVVNIKLFSMYNEINELDGVTIVMKDMSSINKIINTSYTDKKLSSILFKTSNSALILANDIGEIYDVNKNALYTLGLTEEQVLSKNIKEFFEEEEIIADYLEKVKDNMEENDIEAKTKKSQLNVTLLTHPIKNEYTSEIRFLVIMH